jgi:predicted Zn-dependent protease with MMP-like domain
MQPANAPRPDELAQWRRCAETAVNAALDELHDAADGSERILAELARVSVVVRDDADEDDPDLLGMYLGTPVGETDPGMNLPPLVEVYLLPLVDLTTPEHLRHLQPDLTLLAEEVRITVRHEIGHHFGLDHAVLERLGLE